MASPAVEIHDGPMCFTLLNMSHLQRYRFVATETTREQHGQKVRGLACRGGDPPLGSDTLNCQQRSGNIMSNQNRIQHVPAGSGPGYWGPGDQIRFILTGAETGGAFFLAEVSVPPGGGPPPHIHDREDETFYLLQGALTVWVGDQTVYASQGD